MNRIHYEKVLYSGLFPVEEIYRGLSRELPEEVFTFEQFMRTDTMVGMYSGLTRTFNLQDVASVSQLLFHMYSFHSTHGRVYEVSDNIAEMLLNTKLDIDVSLMKSPMFEIILLVPENLLQVHNEITGVHNVYTIYVNFLEATENDKTVKVLCVGRPNENSTDELDDGFFYFRFDLGPGKIMDSVKELTEKWQDDPNRNKYSAISRDLETIPRIAQMVFNAILYITSKDCDIRIQQTRYAEMEQRLNGMKSRGKIQKLSKRLSKESRFPRYVIGNTVSLSNEERDLYKLVRGKLKVRFKVGGHWRAQWYGPRSKPYQKAKWIRPYFKGPELAELIRSIGVLK